MLVSSNKGDLFVDTLKNKRSRTIPLVEKLRPIVEEWSTEKEPVWLAYSGASWWPTQPVKLEALGRLGQTRSPPSGSLASGDPHRTGRPTVAPALRTLGVVAVAVAVPDGAILLPDHVLDLAILGHVPAHRLRLVLRAVDVGARSCLCGRFFHCPS